MPMKSNFIMKKVLVLLSDVMDNKMDYKSRYPAKKNY